MTATTGERWIDYLPLGEIREAETNAKAHADQAITASLRRFGVVEQITMDDRTGRVISGHGRLEMFRRAHQAGEDPPEGIRVLDDGTWAAPVVRGWSSSDDREARAAGIALNRTGELGGWRPEQLAEDLAHLVDDPPPILADDPLAGIGFDHDDLADLLEQLEPPPEPDERDRFTEAEAERPERRVHRGELWQLGPHRLLCGDSFDAGDVDRLLDGGRADLVLTDPPFAVYGSSTGISSSIADDKMVAPFFERLFAMLEPRVPKFAHVYVHCDWRSWATIWRGAVSAGLTPKNCLVWDKGGSGLGSNWANTYELVGYFAKIPDQTTMSNREAGQRVVHRSNMLRYQRPRGAERQHNAAKPVALLAEIIEAGSDPDQLVLDLFGGSGSTLVAADQVGRRCAMMEVEPQACDVIVARWEALTGGSAERLDTRD